MAKPAKAKAPKVRPSTSEVCERASRLSARHKWGDRDSEHSRGGINLCPPLGPSLHPHSLELSLQGCFLMKSGHWVFRKACRWEVVWGKLFSHFKMNGPSGSFSFGLCSSQEALGGLWGRKIRNSSPLSDTSWKPWEVPLGKSWQPSVQCKRRGSEGHTERQEHEAAWTCHRGDAMHGAFWS